MIAKRAGINGVSLRGNRRRYRFTLNVAVTRSLNEALSEIETAYLAGKFLESLIYAIRFYFLKLIVVARSGNGGA